MRESGRLGFRQKLAALRRIDSGVVRIVDPRGGLRMRSNRAGGDPLSRLKIMDGVVEQSPDYVENCRIRDAGNGARSAATFSKQRCETGEDFCDGGTRRRNRDVRERFAGSV